MSELSASQELRHAGLRVTAPRCAVLDWLNANPHATADQVFHGVLARLGGVSVQTIYDVLGVCADNGLVRRLELDGPPARFERRTGDNHHHITCRVCGRIEDVACAAGTRPCLTPSQAYGFHIDEAEVVFRGVCPDCRIAGALAAPNGR